MILKHTTYDEFSELVDSKDSIYHFTRKDTAIEHILPNKNLRFGDFKSSSDPQEYRRILTPAVGYEIDDEYIPKISEISKSIDKYIKSSGFISFCQNTFEKGQLSDHGCLKSRMWSQYGSGHSGICLLFSKQVLVQRIKEELSNNFTIYAEDVTYKDPQIKRTRNALNIDNQQSIEEETNEIALQHVTDLYKKLFFQKQPDYKDEKEFRIVVLSKERKQANGVLLNIDSCLKAIILGDNFPKVYLPTIQLLSKTLNVPYRKLHWERDKYHCLRWEQY